MTIASQLTTLNTTKTNIKAAIEAKGVTVGAVPFADYPSKIALIEGGGGPVEEYWTQSYYEGIRDSVEAEYNAIVFDRPTDWLIMPSITETDQKLNGLYAVYNSESNWIAITATGAYTVDWGDGTVEDFASGTTATRNYVWSNVSDTTLTSEGYRQVMVTVTPQAGETLSNIQLGPAISGLNNVYASNWLDIQLAMNNAGTFSFGSSSSGTRARLLRRFRWLGTNSQTNWSNYFQQMGSLEFIEVDLPTIVNMNSTFLDCYSLKKLPSFVGKSFSNLTNTFQNCHNLIYIPAMTWYISSGNFESGNMARSCSNLKTIGPVTITMPSPANKSLNIDGSFQNCVSLITVPQFSFNTVWISLASNMFNTCSSLQRVPSMWFSGTSYTSMFSNCANLKYVNKLYNINTGSISASSMFVGCYALMKTPEFEGSQYFTNTSSMFSNCFNLQEVVYMNLQNVTNAGSMFNSCRSLTTVPDLNFQSLTSTGGMFDSCVNLKSVTPFSTANVTTMGAMFTGCHSIEDLSWVTFQSATAYNSIFANCQSLNNIPSVVGRVGSTTDAGGVLQNAYSVKGKFTATVLGPGNICQEAYNIEDAEITCSSTSTLMSLNSGFINCYNLKSVKFNYTSTGAFNPGSLINAFNGCRNLREITGLRFNPTNTTSVSTAAFSGCVSLSKLTLENLVATVSVASCALGPAALEELFTSLGTATAKTITITNNWGAALLTQAQRDIAINKGWTIIG